MDTGRKPVSESMKKMCPFKGFTECLQESCMAWSGSDCRMFAMSMFAGLTGVQMSLAQQVNTNEQTENMQKETGAENNTQEKEKQNNNPAAKVYVKEVQVTKNGNTRAVCHVENGKEDQIIIAKNGVGKILQEGQNKKFEIEYNVMKDGTAWYAIRAKQLQ